MMDLNPEVRPAETVRCGDVFELDGRRLLCLVGITDRCRVATHLVCVSSEDSPPRNVVAVTINRAQLVRVIGVVPETKLELLNILPGADDEARRRSLDMVKAGYREVEEHYASLAAEEANGEDVRPDPDRPSAQGDRPGGGVLPDEQPTGAPD